MLMKKQACEKTANLQNNEIGQFTLLGYCTAKALRNGHLVAKGKKMFVGWRRPSECSQLTSYL